MRYANVIVPLAVEGMYTYAVPESLENVVKEGTLVLVAFAGNKKYTAIVGKLHNQKPEGYAVKEIEGIAEEQVKLSPIHLKFIFWLSTYYMATLGEVMKAALPMMFRLESFTSITRIEADVDFSTLTTNEQSLLNFLHLGEYVALKDAEKCLKIKNGVSVVKGLLAKKYIQVKETVDELFKVKTEYIIRFAREFTEEELHQILEKLKRAPAQYKMFCHWIEGDKKEWERLAFLKATGTSATILKGLCEKQILKVEKKVLSRLALDEVVEQTSCHSLSGDQEQAFKQIQSTFTQKECVLLHGVTSSGKTEVYIHLIQNYLDQGKQVLYMLPEIALTVQIVKRLQRVFGENVGIYHSGMSDQMRAELWRKQCSDQPYGVVLGVRSSVLLPFKDLGLIIVDEEHDASYKQKEPAPRYNGRDSAIMLSKMFGAHILLGSATPSFESYQNAISGKYGLVEMHNRYGGVQMPKVILANIGEYRRKKMMKGSFSPLLIDEMGKVLSDGKQIILFQNRRGYSSYMQCEQCGSIPKCKHCDVSMTYYKQRNVLICRYCGSMVKVLNNCTDCGGRYKERVPGTEKVEEEVSAIFPDSKVARMDMNTMSNKSKFRQIIEGFEQGEIDVLIGTQMVTKGLDFENVKLVGVIDADSMISFPDFRAEERAYCMLMQVSGRSGRKGEQGKVIVQASDVKNRVYTMLTDGSYKEFFTHLTKERELFTYPPFGRMIQVEIRHKDVIVLRNAANTFAIRLREKLGRRVCGPAVPDVSRIGGLHRLILILKIEPFVSCAKVKDLLKTEITLLRKDKIFGSLRIVCNVDP